MVVFTNISLFGP